MKKITTFLGCVGVVCLFSGCTSDNLEELVAPVQEDAANNPSSGEAITPTSSANGTSASSAASQMNPAPGASSTSSSKDPTIIHEQVVISGSSTAMPYYSSGTVFCWSAECEAQYAGTSAAAPSSSSSASIDISMSVEAPVYPTVTESQMIDQRDQASYSLTRIGGVHWMTSNLKYKPKSGFFCDNGGTDVCSKYGVFYSYSAAQSACPTGWRLPTQSEVEAANTEKGHDWWTIGGRFKLTSSGEVDGYGLDDEQGYLWLAAGGENNAWRIEDYSGKQLEEATSATDRAFNVRCVEASN